LCITALKLCIFDGVPILTRGFEAAGGLRAGRRARHVARTVLLLASDDAAHIRGQELFVDSGATASPAGAPICRG
jgi:enoyl-[acyl-carrier-protein] reductase (NADH)